MMPLVPSEFFVLIIVGAALALIVGLINRRAAVAVVGIVILVALLRPFIPSLIQLAPWWLVCAIVVVLGLRILGGMARLFLGREAANEMTGTLAADVVRFFVRGAFRSVRWIFRA